MTATEICAMTANPSYVTRFGNHLWICGQRRAGFAHNPAGLTTTESGQLMRYKKRSR